MRGRTSKIYTRRIFIQWAQILSIQNTNDLIETLITCIVIFRRSSIAKGYHDSRIQQGKLHARQHVLTSNLWTLWRESLDAKSRGVPTTALFWVFDVKVSTPNPSVSQLFVVAWRPTPNSVVAVDKKLICIIEVYFIYSISSWALETSPDLR